VSKGVLVNIHLNTLIRTLHYRLGDEPLNASFSWWGCVVGGLGNCGLVILALRHHATNQVEFILGVTASLVTCLLLFLLGALAKRVHLAAWQGRAPWRARKGELLAHGVGLAVLSIGGWTSMEALPGMARALTAGQLVLGFYVAILGLGCWSTLAHASRCSK